MGDMSETASLEQALNYESKTEVKDEEEPLVKPVEAMTVPKVKGGKKLPVVLVLGAVVIIALGIGSGYLLSQKAGGIAGIKSAKQAAESGINVGDVVGSGDEKTFKDDAVGMLEQGGIEGEGSHKLTREGGESQTVYLTSTVVDLEQFVGRKVQVWGETFAAQKAGWLMDVGRVKVLE